MSGILNTTGAVSGILGTTVGTPDGGKVLQVQSKTLTTGYSATETGWTDITGVTIAITPSSTSSKVLYIPKDMRVVDVTPILYNKG